MTETVRVTFERGTLLLEGALAERAPFAVVEEGGRARAPACRFHEIARWADAAHCVLAGDLRARWTASPRSVDGLELRPYQEDALAAWTGLGRRGIVALPTGAGKTRVAIAAILGCGVPAIVLCPTRALLAAWAAELERWGLGPVGVHGDGERTVERVTVMTFESAYRHLDEIGDRFGLLVVDEVHHFAGGVRAEALEACAAPRRLGLTATAPDHASEGMARLADLVGPVVYEIGVGALVGTHLARLSIERIPVRLGPDERLVYDRLVQPFREAARRFFRTTPAGNYALLVRALSATKEGRRALRAHARAVDLAYFPRDKRALVRDLLARHRGDRCIVFTARTEDAYRVAADSLVPVITAEVSARERQRILEKFRAGRVRAIVSARVLNEGIDVPDARVAIVVAGTLGAREHVQRLGRVLRPSPGKHAIAYELVTEGTLDERFAAGRGRHAAAPSTSGTA
jgi:superfamily II DNA or RNA helicase